MKIHAKTQSPDSLRSAHGFRCRNPRNVLSRAEEQSPDTSGLRITSEMSGRNFCEATFRMSFISSLMFRVELSSPCASKGRTVYGVAAISNASETDQIAKPMLE
ncbi:hypothetical protein ISCGN_014735 [Ixodes scapularis]